MTRFKRQTRQQPKASCILSADIHIRPDIPVCRIDDYWAAQERKIDFILDLGEQHNCPILVAGDLGIYPLNNGWPTWLLEWTISKFEGHKIIAIVGQHDLPNHRLDLFEKSGMGVLTAAGVIQTIFEKIDYIPTFDLYPFPYGVGIQHIEGIDGFKRNIAIIHQMIIENKKLWPDQEAPKGHSILKKYPEFDLILSGDNHNAFTVEHNGRWLVNPGSMMRAFADQEDHKPRVYLWYAETNEVVPVYLPIENNVISREHIEMADERSDRMDAYMARVREDVEIQLSYEDNMGRYFEKFRTERPVKAKVSEAMG